MSYDRPLKIYRITFGMRGMEGCLRCTVKAPDSNLAINALLDKVHNKVTPVGLRIAESVFEEWNEDTQKYRRI
jgi:hypothetical protein